MVEADEGLSCPGMVSCATTVPSGAASGQGSGRHAMSPDTHGTWHEAYHLLRSGGRLPTVLGMPSLLGALCDGLEPACGRSTLTTLTFERRARFLRARMWPMRMIHARV